MNIALLLAAGSSTRAGKDKLWAPVCGQALWTLAYQTLCASPIVDGIVVVTRPGEEARFEQELKRWEDKKTQVVTGGRTRMESFEKGVEAARKMRCEKDAKWTEWTEKDVLIDCNAANPKMSLEELTKTVEAAQKKGAAAVALACVDTVLELQKDGSHKVIPRQNLRLMQTPQAVRGDRLRSALLAAEKNGVSEHTDLMSRLVELTPVEILPAHPANKKVTFAEDVEALQQGLFFGEDSHAFLMENSEAKNVEGAVGKPLVLGGVTLAGVPGLVANSDGDVILHAIGRALAQAAGEEFSEVADAILKEGQSQSAAYVRAFLDGKLKGRKISRVSVQVEAARPRLVGHRKAIQEHLATLLSVPEEAVHISAMTGEALTTFGRGEGIRALALVQIVD